MDNQPKDKKIIACESITKEELEENIEDSYKKLEILCEEFERGILDREKLRQRCTGVFKRGFEKFLHDNNLKLIRPSSVREWERFENDYSQWKRGQQIYSNKGDIWLKYLRNKSNGAKAGEEASYIDKERFFRLMEAFCVTTNYYRPAPEGTAFSKRHFGRFHPELIIGFDNYWVDDGGLLSKDFQLGNEVTLKNCNGLEAIVKITEYLTIEEQRKRRIYADYIGIGHIEGYTTDRDREIEISLHDGKVRSLFTRIDNDDRDVFNSFPLWQGELQYNYELGKELWNIVENLIRRFLGDSYSLYESDDKYEGFNIYI